MMELLGSIEQSALAVWVREASTIWAYPTIITLHTVGLAILVGANVAVDLRFLNLAARGVTLEDMRPFFRYMWVGFWINATSGVLLFTTEATTKGIAHIFLLKLGLIACGVVLIVLMRRAVYGHEGPAVMVPASAKAFAALSLFIWMAAITAGRLQAYITL